MSGKSKVVLPIYTLHLSFVNGLESMRFLHTVQVATTLLVVYSPSSNYMQLTGRANFTFQNDTSGLTTWSILQLTPIASTSLYLTASLLPWLLVVACLYYHTHYTTSHTATES